MGIIEFSRDEMIRSLLIGQLRLYRRCQVLDEAKSLLIRANMLPSTGGDAAGWGQGVCCSGGELRP
ncbi:hypothetical protein CGRA01v4_04180 [Colletotrichum graminicola]|nr:hypothetical protein CGRA01v4_04180 [Colletotrichum graminicola]